MVSGDNAVAALESLVRRGVVQTRGSGRRVTWANGCKAARPGLPMKQRHACGLARQCQAQAPDAAHSPVLVY